MQRFLIAVVFCVLLFGTSGFASTHRYHSAKTYTTYHSSRHASASHAHPTAEDTIPRLTVEHIAAQQTRTTRTASTRIGEPAIAMAYTKPGEEMAALIGPPTECPVEVIWKLEEQWNG